MVQQTLYGARKYKRFVPQRSCLHRQAVFALYRALLSQCRALPLGGDDREALRHVVRHRFRDNRHLRSPLRLKLSFHAGYRALDYLDDAVVGCRESTARISDYIERVPGVLKRPSKPSLKSLKIEDPPYVTPSEHQFFNVFPRPAVRGIRRVPTFVRANQFPMVRWKKPQPPRLSRTLRQLNEQKQRDVDSLIAYDALFIPTASHEDSWDLAVDGKNTSPEDQETWETSARAGRKEMEDLGMCRYARMLHTARKMVDIVEAEQLLADKERAAREAITSAEQG